MKTTTTFLFRDVESQGLHERDISEWINIFSSLQDTLQFAASGSLLDIRKNQTHENNDPTLFKSGIVIMYYVFFYRNDIQYVKASNVFTIFLISCTHILIISMLNLQRYINKWKKRLILGSETVSL